ncbi:MAG: protein arginine kinase [Peptococcia bacterium]|jgi:protein arginine kinase
MIKKVVTSTESNWTKQEGPYHHIVISSRIRLARNLAKLPMPAFQDESSAFTVLEKVKKAAETINRQRKEQLYFYQLSELPALERQILLEKHLISPEHREEGPNKGIILSQDESICIMINEEDHLRIQVFMPGLQLDKAWGTADRLDDELESQLEYAFDKQIGYLTCCPTNVGTGLRASVMLHLPALVLTQQVGKVFRSLGQLGFAVRGLYGEGTEAIGNLYQVSNQVTLGKSEAEILQNLTELTGQLVDKEEETRKWLRKEWSAQLKDRVGRALGILQNAAILSSQEALQLISDVKIGMDLGLLSDKQKALLKDVNHSELIVLAQPAFVQRVTGRQLEAAERDQARAELFAQKFGAAQG